MFIIGGDIGHKNAKTCFGKTDKDLDLFRSTVAEVDNDVLEKRNDIIINYNNRDYAVGTEYGAYSVEDDKSKDDIFKICLFTAVARGMSSPIEDVSLVTGLPLNYYKRYKDSLIESLEGKTIKLKIGIETKIINFANVKPYPESAGIIIIDQEIFKGAVIVIDIGGRTVDISYFENGKLVKTGSYDLGMLTVYSTIVKYVNEHYPTDYSVLAAENIIKENKITADDKEIEFNTSRFIKAHANEILRRIKLDFPWKTSKKRFTGGGSIALKDYLPNKSQIKDSTIYDNAKVFYAIGVDKYGC